MIEFFTVALSFPTVIPTGLLGLCLVYWGVAMVGLFDLDLEFGGADSGGAEVGEIGELGDAGVEGGADGGAESGGDAPDLDGGVADVGGVGDVVVADAVALAAAARRGCDAPENEPPKIPFASRWRLIHFWRVPLTLSVTVFVVLWWVMSHIGTQLWLEGTTDLGLGHWALLTGTMGAAAFGAWVTLAPVGSLFVHRVRIDRSELLARFVEIRSLKVDRVSGQGLIRRDGAELLLEIRADPKCGLRRGERALIVSHSPADDIYEVASIADILPSENRLPSAD